VDLLFFGSTARHVIREAECALLTLRRQSLPAEAGSHARYP
jgi:hypothetical protein